MLNRLKTAAQTGSPPQVRGKLYKHRTPAADSRITPAGAGKTARQAPEALGFPVCGITPAGAGKTFVLFPALRAAKDHPRRCGENSQLSVRTLIRPGSPPQVRGKRLICCACVDVNGITPAGAGKTFSFFISPPYHKDHPRRCGENGDCYDDKQISEGSPPQVRGKLDISPCCRLHGGITPAGAGKTA